MPLNRCSALAALLLVAGWSGADDGFRDGAVSYGDRTWNALVLDSYRYTGVREPDFASWLDELWKKHTGAPIANWIAQQKSALTKESGKTRPAKELVLATKLHRTLKKAIPYFNLDRGFELGYLATRKERQCLLQSVLISAMLTKAGVPAGISMVWKSPNGAESNLGHVVSLIRLSDGRRAIVDASEPTPFLSPTGIFTRVGSAGRLRFLLVSQPGTQGITAISDRETSKAVAARELRPLSIAYMKSQFLFYRAERVPGGLLSAKPTAKALAESERVMRQSVAACPENPLAMYSLGRVLLKQKTVEQATSQVERGYLLYQRAGFVPKGVQDMRAAVRLMAKRG